MEIYIAIDLLFVDCAYRFNAVYAFKSKTSVENYEKYLKNSNGDHKLIVCPVTVTDLRRNLEVVTVFDIHNDLPEYNSTTVFDDYDDARDYVANIKDSRQSVQVSHNSVKIASRFTPSMLHSGWA